VQGVDRVYDLNFNGREGAEKVTYGDVFLQAEREYSRHNFEHSDADMLFKQFSMAEEAPLTPEPFFTGATELLESSRRESGLTEILLRNSTEPSFVVAEVC